MLAQNQTSSQNMTKNIMKHKIFMFKSWGAVKHLLDGANSMLRFLYFLPLYLIVLKLNHVMWFTIITSEESWDFFFSINGHYHFLYFN